TTQRSCYDRAASPYPACMSISTADSGGPSEQPRTAAGSPVSSHVVVREPAARQRAAQYLALDDLERAARRRLPRMIYGFIAGGAETESSVRANRASFGRHALVPRVLIDSSARSTAVTLFGRSYAAPFGIAPLGAAALCAYRGDLALARGAAEAGLPMILSATSLIPLEQVRAAGGG